MKKSLAVIIDLDGTLCNNAHRQGYVGKVPKDWKRFYNGIHRDKLNEWCDMIIDGLNYQVKILLVTGRPETFKKQTIAWLNKYLINYDMLYMRGEGDFREDCITKEEIYLKLIKPRFKVLFCIDDRARVVAMWRKNGLVCLQCAEGDF